MTTLSTQNPVLLLGASGKIGQMLMRHWVGHSPADWRVLAQTRGAPPPGWLGWSPSEDLALVPKARAVICLWRGAPGDGFDLDQNTDLALQAIKVARACGADRVLLASSGAVYDPMLDKRHSETDQNLNPPGAYGVSKLKMEQAARQYCDSETDMPALCCLRIGNVIGADSLFAALVNSSQITLDKFASGFGPSRSYIAPGDLARVFEVLVTCPKPSLPTILNVGGATPILMQDLVKSAGASVTFQPAPTGASERVQLDTHRLERLTGPLENSSDAVCAIADWRRLQGGTP